MTRIKTKYDERQVLPYLPIRQQRVLKKFNAQTFLKPFVDGGRECYPNPLNVDQITLFSYINYVL